MMIREWKTVPLSEVAIIERYAIQPDEIQEGTLYLGLEHIEIGGTILDAKTVNVGELASSKFNFSKSHVLYGSFVHILQRYLVLILMVFAVQTFFQYFLAQNLIVAFFATIYVNLRWWNMRIQGHQGQICQD